MESMSAAEARRVSLAAQGLRRRVPASRPAASTVLRTVRAQGALQIDSVNVLARAHYLPVFSRLGPYRTDLLDRLTYRDRALYEAWSHAASLVPVELWPHHAWRREQARRDYEKYLSPERHAYIERVRTELAERGPISAAELSEGGPRRGGSWFDRSPGKQALEYLFAVGAVAVADRRGFERVYDLAERVIPASVFGAPSVPVEEAHRHLVLHAADALGVATLDDLADYFRLKQTPARRTVAALVADGVLIEVAVEGWDKTAYTPAACPVPRTLDVRALVSPFDPMVWHRPRTERLFGFRYRIEIYVPAPKRVHGYYVLPFVLGDRPVARVDLKADRAARSLRVFSAWREDHAPDSETAVALAAELRLLATWLDLDDLVVEPVGDLGPALAASVDRAEPPVP